MLRSDSPAFVCGQAVRAAPGRRALVWLVGCVLAAAGCSLARAQPKAERLGWDAPRGCPDASEVLVRVRRQIADRNLSDREWHAHAQVRPRGERYRLELTLYWPGGEARRELEAVSCDALADAAGVLISLALTDAAEPEPAGPPPTAASPPVEPAPASRPTVAARSAAVAAAAAPQTAPEEDAPEPSAAGGLPSRGESEWPLRYGLIASVRLDVGMLPQQPAFGLGPRFMLQLGPLQAMAGLTWWIVARSQPESYPSARLEAGGLVGDLVFGFELSAGSLRFAPCLVFEHGQLQVSAVDIASPDSTRISWTAAGGGVRAGVELGWGMHAGLELLGLVPWSRQQLWLHTPAGDVSVFVPAAVALRISAELAYVFE